jgi:hypothetical protein
MSAGTELHAVSQDSNSLSLYQLLDPDILANPYPLYHRLQQEKPVYWDPYLHAWVVTRYADVQHVLRRFSAERTPSPQQLHDMGLGELSPVAQLMVKQMLFLDAPAHTRLRSLAAHAFTPARVAHLRDHIQAIVDRLLDDVEARGSMDAIADLAIPLPAIVTAEMLGVPVEDRHLLKSWSADFAQVLGNFQHNPDFAQRTLQCVEAMTAYFHKTVCEQRRHPADGQSYSILLMPKHRTGWKTCATQRPVHESSSSGVRRDTPISNPL